MTPSYVSLLPHFLLFYLLFFEFNSEIVAGHKRDSGPSNDPDFYHDLGTSERILYISRFITEMGMCLLVLAQVYDALVS